MRQFYKNYSPTFLNYIHKSNGMMNRNILLLLAICTLSTGLNAQSAKKLEKSADALYEQGKFAEAAQTYESAWQKKKKNTELIFKAGEAYYSIKDYRKAAESYQHVRGKNDEFPLVGLKYARSLKQDGQYDKAKDEFKKFMEGYTGENKAILEDIIQTEIRGCDLGTRLPVLADRTVEVQYPGSGINSDDAEFAPNPISDDELYFSSAIGGKARIYVSTRQANRWSKASIPANFPVVSNSHFCNGSMTPDGERIYFTVCNAEKAWNDLSTRCEIFVTKKSGTGWSQPERLPDYVNLKGMTATHPNAAHVNGQELLYFASNREGGRGGMDIWYVVRDLGLEGNDFTFPVNAGPVVNTLGDEITPWYDSESGNLYFASNGHASIGGFDIFRSQGSEVNWSVPENAGLPINSSADDYFYVKSPSQNTAFVVSNRIFGGEKTTTRNADIFELSSSSKRLALKGNVYDKASGDQLANITVMLYQVFDDGTDNLLVNKNFNTGNYTFELLANRRFRVEVQSEGYESTSYEFATDDPNNFTYGQPVFLNGGAPLPSDPIIKDDPIVMPNDDPKGQQGATTYTLRGTSPDDNLEYASTAPRHKGLYYKVQAGALKQYSSNRKDLKKLEDLGRVDTEKIVSNKLTRVMVGDFFTKEEALRAVKAMQDRGFPEAFVVQYENGVRYGKVTLE